MKFPFVATILKKKKKKKNTFTTQIDEKETTTLALDEQTSKHDKMKKETRKSWRQPCRIFNEADGVTKLRGNLGFVCISLMDSAGGDSVMEHADKSRPER